MRVLCVDDSVKGETKMEKKKKKKSFLIKSRKEQKQKRKMLKWRANRLR